MTEARRALIICNRLYVEAAGGEAFCVTPYYCPEDESCWPLGSIARDKYGCTEVHYMLDSTIWGRLTGHTRQ